MISRIDHISVAVRDLEKARNFFVNVLGAVPGQGAVDENLKFSWEIFSLGDLSRLEIISPTGEGSFIDGFLKKREGGFHHMTLQVPDIEKTRDMLRNQNIPFYEGTDYGDEWKEIFIYPKDAFGILVQLSQFNPNHWLADSVKHDEEKKWQVSKEGDDCVLTLPHPGGGRFTLKLDKADAGKLAGELMSAFK